MKRIFFYAALLTISACWSGEEGCTDPLAASYNPAADSDCACCTYYQLRLSTTPLVTGDYFTTEPAAGEVYKVNLLDTANDTFLIRNMAFLISDIRLVRADGSEAFVNREITLPNSTVSRIDNFAKVTPTVRTYDIGRFDKEDVFISIRFTVGLMPDVNTVDAKEMPTGHALAIDEDSLFLNTTDGYIFNKIQVVLRPSLDSLDYFVTGSTNYVPVQLDLPRSVISSSPDKNTEVKINIDYSKFFTGVSFLNDTPNIVLQKVVDNTRSAF
jgi:hypothetical protein